MVLPVVRVETEPTEVPTEMEREMPCLPLFLETVLMHRRLYFGHDWEGGPNHLPPRRRLIPNPTIHLSPTNGSSPR